MTDAEMFAQAAVVGLVLGGVFRLGHLAIARFRGRA